MEDYSPVGEILLIVLMLVVAWASLKIPPRD